MQQKTEMNSTIIVSSIIFLTIQIRKFKMPTIIRVPNNVETFQEFVDYVLVPILNDLTDKDNARQKQIEELKNQNDAAQAKINELIAHINKIKKSV